MIHEVERRQEAAGVDVHDVHETLTTYSDKTIEALHAAIIYSSSRFINRSSTNLIDMISVLGVGMTEAQMNQFLWFAPQLSSDYGYTATVLNGLKMNEGLEPHADYSLAPQPVRDQCFALLKVITAMSTFSGKGAPIKHYFIHPSFPNRWISDSRIVALVLENPEVADRIAAIIEEYHRADYGLIDAVLHQGNVPLSEGVL